MQDEHIKQNLNLCKLFLENFDKKKLSQIQSVIEKLEGARLDHDAGNQDGLFTQDQSDKIFTFSQCKDQNDNVMQNAATEAQYFCAPKCIEQ